MPVADTYFDCSETPLWFPDVFDLASIQTCTSCILRLVSKLAGPGNVQTAGDRLVFQENPMTTLSVNGIQHNVQDSSLLFPGAHKLIGRSGPCPAEAVFQFQHTTIPNRYILVHIPLDVGTGPANSYFSTLTAEVRNDRPTLAALCTKDMKFVSFEGVALRGRTATDIQKPKCDPPSSILTYYVSLTPAMITIDDFTRLKAMYGTKPAPPKPYTPSAKPERLTKLCTVIQGIILDSDSRASNVSPYGVPTKAMKCVRLDKERDIVGDKVYVNGTNKPGTMLSDELAYNNDLNAMLGISTPTTEASIQPGDIEQVLGIVVGVILGLLIASAIAVFVYKFIYTGYIQQQQLYATAPTASTQV